MISQKLKDSFGEAYATVIHRLSEVCDSCGEDDFPSDKGYGLRNELFMFLHGFGSELHREDYPEGDWQETIVPLLEEMSPSQLVRVIGILHVYSCCVDYCLGEMTPPQLNTALNWVSYSYKLHEAYSEEWFYLVTKCRDTFRVREGIEKMYHDVSLIICADPADTHNRGSLSGLAFICQHGMERDPIAVAERCARVFDD